MMQNIPTIDRRELEQKIRSEKPNNRDRDDGYALINVLDQKTFQQAHIPHSINIPNSQIERFGERFAKDKEIIVYCASHECDASTKAANALAEQGFENVVDYEGGMADWKSSGNEVAVGAA